MRRRLTLALAVALLVGIRGPRLAAQASEVRPGDDFFAYANAAWLRTATIPAGRDRWGARDEINLRTRQQVIALLEEAANASAGTRARKVADFRAAYLDESAIEAAGLRPLQHSLDSIAGITDKRSLARYLGAELRADVDPLNWGVFQSATPLGLSVEIGMSGEPTYLPFLVQGGLGLGDRAPYLDTDPASTLLRDRYQSYLTSLLTQLGAERAEPRARAVLALETALARSQTTPAVSADEANAQNRWTQADYARYAPGMEWTSFFAAAGLSRERTIVAWQPSAITGVAALVASEPLEVWRDYLRVRLIDRYAEVLPRTFAGPAAEVHGTTGERSERARAVTLSMMSEQVGRLYAERHLSEGQKARVRRVVANVTRAFIRRVEGASWMAPATRQQALQKLRTLYVGVGYPERWVDDADLVIDPRDALGNVRRIEGRARRQALARLGRPVDRTDWNIPPQLPGAVLIFQQNTYQFAAALLQAPKFDSTASEAALYGSIGAIIGHDVTHIVDRLGAEYDTIGVKRRWWTSGDSAGFQHLADRLDMQFSAYRPFPDLGFDGRLSERENIADLGGLAAAFDAYRLTLGERARDTAVVRQHDREFFTAYAQGWRSTMTDAALRTLVRTSDHAPDRYRVNIVRNLDAWYEAFDVKPGDALYLPPEGRVRVW